MIYHAVDPLLSDSYQSETAFFHYNWAECFIQAAHRLDLKPHELLRNSTSTVTRTEGILKVANISMLCKYWYE